MTSKSHFPNFFLTNDMRKNKIEKNYDFFVLVFFLRKN